MTKAVQIADFLAATDVAIDVGASDKSGLLRALASRAAAALHLTGDVVAAAIAKRDALGSTGIGGGISIPHARLPGIEKPFGLFVRLKTPIDFEAIDGEPVDLVFLLLLPDNASPDQLNALAAVARKLRDPKVLLELRNAPRKAHFYRAIIA